MERIRKGDEVIVLTGKDKGKRGSVVSRVSDVKVIVSGINRVSKHVKPNPVKGEAGGIVQKEMPIQESNLAIFNPKTGKADRVRFGVAEDGKKVRLFVSSGEQV